MVLPKTTAIYLAPAAVFVEATIGELTDITIAAMLAQWWTDPALKPDFDPPPIDRFWSWRDSEIELDGAHLRATRLGLFTADDRAQGAMFVSVDPCPSVLESAALSLFVELLFTAPWNRPSLRFDGKPYYRGVGNELLRRAAELSQEFGYGGRLRLDGSPKFIQWYENRGFKLLDEPPVVYENIEYKPMELSLAAAQRWLQS